MSKKKPKPVLPTLGAIIIFPSRMWEPGDNGWTSRPVLEHERLERKKLAEQLSARMEVSE
jgi:hypothetical protein